MSELPAEVLRCQVDSLREVARTENFYSGDTACIRCGKVLHLYFNGGELDKEECCGLEYCTEVQRIDLVVYEKTPNLELSRAACVGSNGL